MSVPADDCRLTVELGERNVRLVLPRKASPIVGTTPRSYVRTPGILHQPRPASEPHLELAPATPPTRRMVYRLHTVPPQPLRPFVKVVFMVSEIPFLILMTYAIYWCEICYLAAYRAPATVWLNAIVAGVLVGMGLNANAYRALYRPISRARKRQVEKRRGIDSCRYVTETVSPASYTGGLSTRSLRIPAFVSSARLPLQWSEDEQEFDVGMMMRFFIIPFGVSSLSGITNNARDQFILVFPRERAAMLACILLPASAVATLVLMRLYFILTIPLRPFRQALFVNGKILL